MRICTHVTLHLRGTEHMKVIRGCTQFILLGRFLTKNVFDNVESESLKLKSDF